MKIRDINLTTETIKGIQSNIPCLLRHNNRLELTAALRESMRPRSLSGALGRSHWLETALKHNGIDAEIIDMNLWGQTAYRAYIDRGTSINDKK